MFDKLICAISIICLAVVLVLVLKDSLRTFSLFQVLVLVLVLVLGGQVLVLVLGDQVQEVLVLVLVLGVRSLSLPWSLRVRSLSLSLSLGVRSLLTSLVNLAKDTTGDHCSDTKLYPLRFNVK